MYPYNDTELEPIELGASIFVRINKNLWRATEEFGLERISFGDDGDVMGLWDGKDVILTVCTVRCTAHTVADIYCRRAVAMAAGGTHSKSSGGTACKHPDALRHW